MLTFMAFRRFLLYHIIWVIGTLDRSTKSMIVTNYAPKKNKIERKKINSRAFSFKSCKRAH